jgi:hypothetical protein
MQWKNVALTAEVGLTAQELHAFDDAFEHDQTDDASAAAEDERVALQNLDVQRLVGDQPLKSLILLLQLAQSPRGVPRFLHNTAFSCGPLTLQWDTSEGKGRNTFAALT